MLTFLRKIRRSLIQSGSSQNPSSSASKYLLYAVGEIALVMIGILLALQVNNWNEGRIDKRYEKIYLEEILEDLYDDKEEILEVYPFAEV